MVKIVFVCYDQGAGGEHLSVEISKLENCNTLPYTTVDGRYFTVDITKGMSRYTPLPVKEINECLTESDKWHVIPTHFLPATFDQIRATKFFVCITTPSSAKHQEVIQQKIFSRRFTDILHIKGQIEADGFNPKVIMKKYKGPLDYQSLLCLYKGLEINEANIEMVKEEYLNENVMDYKFNKTIPDAFNVAYEDTLLPNFYQQFTKNLHKKLTKSV
jgi:hypothetical protein